MVRLFLADVAAEESERAEEKKKVSLRTEACAVRPGRDSGLCRLGNRRRDLQ